MSDLQKAFDGELAGKDVAIVAVAIPDETKDAIDQFKKNYGITFPVWRDTSQNYLKLVPPGGRQFPLEVVIDRDYLVVYLENDYYPGEAIKAIKKAL